MKSECVHILELNDIITWTNSPSGTLYLLCQETTVKFKVMSITENHISSSWYNKDDLNQFLKQEIVAYVTKVNDIPTV